MDELCKATLKFRKPHPCVSSTNANLQIDEYGNLIAVTKCLFCKKIMNKIIVVPSSEIQ